MITSEMGGHPGAIASVNSETREAKHLLMGMICDRFWVAWLVS